MVEVEAEMEIWWVGGQKIGDDIFEPFQIERAEGFKKFCCLGRIKDIGVDVITEYGQEVPEIVIFTPIFLHRTDFGFLFVLLGKPCQIVDFFLVGRILF